MRNTRFELKNPPGQTLPEYRPSLDGENVGFVRCCSTSPFPQYFFIKLLIFV